MSEYPSVLISIPNLSFDLDRIKTYRLFVEIIERQSHTRKATVFWSLVGIGKTHKQPYKLFEWKWASYEQRGGFILYCSFRGVKMELATRARSWLGINAALRQ